MDEVLSINPYANGFVFQYFKVHQKVWLTYSGGVDVDLVNCYNLKRPYSVNFPTEMSVTLTFLLVWIYSFFLMLVFVLQWLSPYGKILIVLLSQFPLTF